MDFEIKFNYFDWKREMDESFAWFEERYEGLYDSWEELIQEFQNDYLEINAYFQDDDRIRLCIMLPLIQFEIHNNALTPELYEELEIYYDEYNKGVYNDMFSNSEHTVIKAEVKI